MFLSSQRRPPSSVNRPNNGSRGLPSAALSGTSLSRPRATRPNRPNRPPTASTAYSDNPSSTDEEITIHVCDEAKRVNKDFKCSKSILMNRMKYFESHLQNCQAVEDLEISVHCDVDIFDWLMQYINGEERPRLEVAKVISILISSEFLQMEDLVLECLEFVKDNLERVVMLPLDMNCLNNNLVKKLGEMVTAESLEQVKDPKDRLLSRLYMKKFEELLSEDAKDLNRCVYCNKLFTTSQHEWMVCEKARIFIDFHGNVIAEHVADRNWDINKFLMYVKQQGLTWREIYWKLWGRLVSFNCVSCGSEFVGAELGHCSYHPQEPRFPHGRNTGYYQCCEQKAVRFDTSIQKKGCSARNHVPKNDQLHSREYDLLIKKFSILEEPFGSKAEGKMSLQKILDTYVRNEDDDFESEDEESEVEEVKEEEKKTKNRTKSRTKKHEMNPKKQRVWKLDNLRLKDLNSMKELTNNLTRMRRRKNMKSKAKKK